MIIREIRIHLTSTGIIEKLIDKSALPKITHSLNVQCDSISLEDMQTLAKDFIELLKEYGLVVE